MDEVPCLEICSDSPLKCTIVNFCKMSPIMSHTKFLERLFEGKKGEERDKKDPLNDTRMRYTFIRIQEVRIIDVISVSHTSNR
jgi:hypothetical protein